MPISNAIHQNIVDNLRRHYDERLTRAEKREVNIIREAEEREAQIVKGAGEKINGLVSDLNKLSAEVAELRGYKSRTERTVEILRGVNGQLSGQLAAAEEDLEIYRAREKAARKKAAKEREAEVKVAKDARKRAAENGEQWAVEDILHPKQGLFG